VLANTLTKLVLRLEEVQPSKTEVNKATTGALLIMVSLLQLGSSQALPKQMDGSSYDKIMLFVKLLSNTGGGDVKKVLLKSCHESFARYLSEKQMREKEEIKAKAQDSHAQPDDLIDFYHLKNRKVCIQVLRFFPFCAVGV
jgi:coatomer subunit beta